MTAAPLAESAAHAAYFVELEGVTLTYGRGDKQTRALGLTNLIIALYFDLRVWAWFVTAISVGAKLAALALQYAVFRTLVRRRLARAPGLHPRGAK